MRNVQTFCDVILQSSGGEKGWSKPLNMSQWSTYLNYDIMGDLVFGRRFNVMTSDAHRFVPKLLMNSTAFIYTVRSAITFFHLQDACQSTDCASSLLPCLSRLSCAVYSRAAFLAFLSLGALWQGMTASSINTPKTC